MTVRIELLVVPGCPHEAAASELIRAAVGSAGVSASVTRTVIATEQEAVARGFVGSPTILVNGADPFAQPGQSIGLACRLYPTADGLRGAPELGELSGAIGHAAT